MKRPYITRKNLIAIAIAALYAILFVFVGLCLTATKDSVIAETNMFLAMSKSFGFTQITLEGANGVASLALTGVYIVVLVFGLIYVRRFQVINNIKWRNWKLWLAYILVVVLSVGLSIGLSFIFTLDNPQSFVMMLTLIGETFAITSIAAFAVAVLVLAICML